MAEDDPLAVLFAAMELRTGDGESRAFPWQFTGLTRRAMDAYCAVAAHHPDAEPLARGAMAPLSARVRADASMVGQRLLVAPFHPAMNSICEFILTELSTLAAVFVTMEPSSRAVPDPADEYAGEYDQLRAQINELALCIARARPGSRVVLRSV